MIVTDRRDKPIRDLTIKDFEISDAGSARPVDAAALESSPNGRLMAIFLDEYHVTAGENTARVKAALTQFVETELRDSDQVAIMKPLDPLGSIQITRDRDVLRAAINSFSGRKGDYEPKTPFEDRFMSRTPATAEASRCQVVSSALQALAMRIGAVREGRKSIVLISEGFSPSAPRGSDRLMGSVRAVVYASNRYGVAIYPIDPRIDAPSVDDDTGVATLEALAKQTGGETTASADMAPRLAMAVRDLDDYYLLTYRAAVSGDGKFHPVEVRVKRASAQIRTRSGYWAANPDLYRPVATIAARLAATPTRPPHASPLIRQWTGTERGADGLTRVTLSWERGVPPPRNQQIATVMGKVTAPDGRVLFEQPIAPSASFDAPPGRVDVELRIQGMDGKLLDSDFRSLVVPDLRVARPTLATVQVIRTRNAREFAVASKDADQPPSASREFSRTERLLIRVPLYGADPGTPVTATLLNRAGGTMRTLPIVDAPLPDGVHQFDLPLSSLAPDDYQVAIAAGAPDQAPLVKATLLLRVTN